MDNQVSGVLCLPVSPYNYIFHSFVTSVNRLYRYKQLLWALLNHCVKAGLVVIKDLLDIVSGPAACGRNGILFSWEDVWNRGQPSTCFALGIGHSGACVLPSGWGHLHRLSLSREGSILSRWWRYQIFSDVCVSSWSVWWITQCGSYLWTTKVERRHRNF